MVVQSPKMDLQIPETDILTHLFGYAQPSDQPIWIDATDPRKYLSARSLLQWAKRLALGLDHLGIKPGEVVLICSPNHIFVPAAYLGIIGSGRIFTGANPAYTADGMLVQRKTFRRISVNYRIEISHQIQDSSARIVLVHPGFVETARTALQNTGLSEDCLFLFSDEEIKARNGVKDWRSILGSEVEAQRHTWTRLGSESRQKIATINYSSGTTGLPKGVMITHFNLIANVEQLIFNKHNKQDSISPSPERWIGFLPLYHAFGQIYTCLMTVRSSNPIYIMKTFVFEDFLKVIETHRITDIQVPPPILVMLRKRPETSKYDLSSLKKIVCGAAPLSAELQDSCANRYNVIVSQGWGMTEVTCAGTGHPAGIQGLAGSIGMLLPNCEARIVDETGNEVKVHEQGEMQIRGPNISLGYWRNQEATGQSMLPGGWLKTGDVAIHDEEGRLWIVDRLKVHTQYLLNPDLSNLALMIQNHDRS